MFVVVVDVICALMIIGGLVLAIRGARRDRSDAPRPAAYATRIAGVMIAAFGLALGTLVTTFTLVSG